MRCFFFFGIRLSAWLFLLAGLPAVAVARPDPPRAVVSKSQRPLASSFEGEISLSRSKRIFRYYAPLPAQAAKLDPTVMHSLVTRPEAHSYFTNRGVTQWQKRGKEATFSWSSLTDEGKSAFCTELFSRQTQERLLPDFFKKYRAKSFTMDPAQWSKLSRKKKLAHLTYDNLNQQGRKRYKEIIREAFPLMRRARTPRAFEQQLFWETPTTYEMRHHGKTDKLSEVARSIRWMKKNIGEEVRPHQHISWKPNLSALTKRRKEFLSFVQRVDMLMFAQRLEKGSAGALYGAYGKNFMPYSASKLDEIDASLVKRTYDLILGSKLHGLGLRTYRDGTMGLEIRAVTDPEQIQWYAALLRHALTKGAIGAVRYDEHRLEFGAVGSSLQAAIRGQGGRAPGARSPAADARWIDQELTRAGLDQRVSFPLLAWEQQSFIPATKRATIVQARADFVREMAQLFAHHRAHPLPHQALREKVLSAVWTFSRTCQLSQDLQHSLEAPLARRATGPSLMVR